MGGGGMCGEGWGGVGRGGGAEGGGVGVARLFNEFTVKELNLYPYPSLIAHNESFEDITLVGEIDFEVFGVVTNVIRPIGRGTKRPIYK